MQYSASGRGMGVKLSALTLDRLPNVVTPRFKDVAPADIVVVEHITLAQNLRVPLREVKVLAHSDTDKRGITDLRVRLGTQTLGGARGACGLLGRSIGLGDWAEREGRCLRDQHETKSINLCAPAAEYKRCRPGYETALTPQT